MGRRKAEERQGAPFTQEDSSSGLIYAKGMNTVLVNDSSLPGHLFQDQS